MKTSFYKSGDQAVMVLSVLLLSAFWCHARDVESILKCMINVPEDIREQLWQAQENSLPSCDFSVFVQAGDFLYFGMSDAALELEAGLLPVEGQDGLVRWPVTVYEDPVSHDTVFLNAYGDEVFRLFPPEGYNPFWVLTSIFPEGCPEGLDFSAYNPSRVVVSANLIAPENLLCSFSELSQQTSPADAEESGSLAAEANVSGRTPAIPAGHQGAAPEEKEAKTKNEKIAVPDTSPKLADTRCDQVFVDARTGDDGYSGRSSVVRAVDGELVEEGPKKTLRAGLSAVRGGGWIVVTGGSFSEDLDVRGQNVNVSIDGVVSLGSR